MIWPFSIVDRLLTRWAERQFVRDKSLVVEGPEAERRMFGFMVVRVVVGIAALLAAETLPAGTWWQTLCWAIIGGMLGMSAQGQLRRAKAYRSGWLAGRNRMHQMLLAHATEDAVRNEMLYDTVHVMGFGVTGMPDSPEGLENE